MSSTQIETVTTGADKAKLAAALFLAVAGVAAFYLLGQQSLWMRVLTMLVLIAVGLGVFLTSGQGKELVAYGQDALKELRKVVWPTRPEAMQMTLYVFAFVVVMALFLWLTDKALEWVLYSLVLGWKQ